MPPQHQVSDQDNNRYSKIKADFQSIEIPRQPVGNWFTNLINRLIHQEHTKNVKIPIIAFISIVLFTLHLDLIGLKYLCL